MSEKWVVVIPCGNEVIPTILELKNRCYKVVGIDQNNDAPAFLYCDKKVNTALDDYESILYFLAVNNISPEWFFPVVSDKAILPAHILNSLYGFVESNKNILAYFSKSMLRQTLERNSLPTPKFASLSDKAQLSDLNFKGKIIVKPDDSSGSRGITILELPERQNLETAYDTALKFSVNQNVIVEEYIVGDELMVDCFIYKNNVKALLVSQKEKIGDKVSSLIFSLNKTDFPYDKLERFLEKLTLVLDYSNGPMHIEMKYWNNQFYILDLAVRGGGFGIFNYYSQKASGFNFVNAAIDANLTNQIAEQKSSQKEGLIYFLAPEKEGFIQEVICDYELATDEDVKIDFYYTKGQFVTTDVIDGNRLAGIFCFSETKEELFGLLERIKKSIKIIYKDERAGN